ncbi:hypothetical protein UMC2_33741 [[Clostridium] sordellii]|nr:hypothetical protein UMC2_33741 [[Clostridium] sordellii] [Paeniclostridium sordellii]
MGLLVNLICINLMILYYLYIKNSNRIRNFSIKQIKILIILSLLIFSIYRERVKLILYFIYLIFVVIEILWYMKIVKKEK